MVVVPVVFMVFTMRPWMSFTLMVDAVAFPFTNTVNALVVGFGYTCTFISDTATTPLLCGLLLAIPSAQAPNFTFDVLAPLKLQLLNDCTITFPSMEVAAGYETLMLVVPCPLTNVAPAGIFHTKLVAFDGIADIEYVYTRSGHALTLITSIGLGMAAVNLPIANVLALLLPQPFVETTDIVPDVNPAGYLNDTVFVP
jgi:hypothetical protein